jgi:ribosomal protein L16 Arg81 hydroxylase
MTYHGLDMGNQHKIINQDFYEVTLDEGDILYHPAGIWHQVECKSEESISINFSIRQIRIADLVSNAQRMLMLQ